MGGPLDGSKNLSKTITLSIRICEPIISGCFRFPALRPVRSRHGGHCYALFYLFCFTWLSLLDVGPGAFL